MQLKLIDLLLILIRFKKIFIINFLLFSIVSATISLIVPLWYTSTAKLMPPESQQSDFMGIAAMVANIPFDLPGMDAIGTGPSDLYLAIMRSRNVRERVLERLDLKEYFKKEKTEDALKQLSNQTRLDKTEENLIIISCEERSPELAQKMVATFLEELDRVNKEVRQTSAGNTRSFIQGRLEQAEKEMQLVAQKMADFQRKNGAFDIENQVKAQLETSAKLRAELVLMEVEESVLNTFVANSPELKKKQASVAELQKQIDKLQKGISPIENDVLLPFSKVPEMGKEYIFLRRDIEVQKVIYQLLTQQFEQAKIQEAKDTPTIQILDSPSLASRKTRPKRSLIVISAALASIFFSMLIIWVKIFLQELQRTDQEKYNRLLQGARTIHRIG